VSIFALSLGISLFGENCLPLGGLAQLQRKDILWVGFDDHFWANA
jgi:hypothetical protein